MLGRLVVSKRRRIFEDSGRKMSTFLMCVMMSSFLVARMQKLQAGCASVDLASTWQQRRAAVLRTIFCGRGVLMAWRKFLARHFCG
jgi:hypothetical protein